MKLDPFNQTQLYGLNVFFNEIINLIDSNKLPNKILLTGSKGIGKSTLAIHLINYVLSKEENFQYDLENFKINDKNKSHKLIQNRTSPNFYYVNIKIDKKYIDINQIRDLIKFCNKSSFNNNPRFILIDNIEFLNLNSSNALLKILEEPNYNIHFILINNGKNILSTIKSRCLNFNIFLSFEESISVFNKITGNDAFLNINKDLINHYFTPGNLLNLYNFSKENNIDISNINLNDFLLKLIDSNYYKKENSINDLIYELIQMFYLKKVKTTHNFDDYSDYIRFVNDSKIFNLDIENIFLKLRPKLINE